MSNDSRESPLRTIVTTVGLDSLLEAYRDEESAQPCTCDVTVDGEVLTVDATGCDGDGDLAREGACRRSVVEPLIERDVAGIVVRDRGLEYRYDERGVSLLSSAGRFVELLGERDERLAETALEDPLSVAEEVGNRVGPIADVGVESGLTNAAAEIESYERALEPDVGLTIGHYFLDRSMTDGVKLQDVRTLSTESEARIYDRPDSVPLYTLDAVDVTLTPDERELVLEAYEAIANGIVEGDRAASRAVEHVADGPTDPLLTTVLAKHTRGYGILEDLFADPRVSDVYVTAPVETNPLRLVVDGESMATNVYLTPDGAGALASRIRRTSGRAFSRANPTVDATAALENGTGVRIAGVTDPVSDGIAFAFRERADDSFTLPALVANGTMSADVAAFLSVAVERNAAILVAGTRGAGKTTLLGTLLYELPPDTRTVVIEDTPELPVGPLQSVDRDVQALRTGTGDGPEISSADALKTALRLGDGALVVGEIRGEEARVLYEAMRVGANANAVLGTIHGDGGEDVYERVVTDLGVKPSSFGATDLVVTVQAYRTPNGKKRRVSAVEEVVTGEEGIWFEPLYAIDDRAAAGRETAPTDTDAGAAVSTARSETVTASSTARIDRGESRLVDRLTGPTEEYADVRRDVERRARVLSGLARDGRTSPQEVAAAAVDRERELER